MRPGCEEALSTVWVSRPVKEGEPLAELTDLFGDQIGELRSPVDGPVLFLGTSPALNKNDSPMAIGV